MKQPLFEQLLEQRQVEIRAFIGAGETGDIEGLDSCCPDGVEASYETLEVGGLVVGLVGAQELGCDGYMWLACVMTDKSLQLYANTHESDAIKALLNR